MKSSNAYRIAFEEAAADTVRLREESAALREKLAAVDRKILEREKLVHDLGKLVPENERHKTLENLKCKIETVKLEPDSGSAPYRRCLEFLFSKPYRPWNAQEIREKLVKDGYEFNPKYVNNILNRLCGKGAIIRAGRGVYVAREFGVVEIEGEQEIIDTQSIDEFQKIA